MNEFKFVKKVKIERGRGHKLLYTGVEMRMYLCKDIMYLFNFKTTRQNWYM